MSDKDYGSEIDRQAFIQAPEPTADPASGLVKAGLAVAAIAVIAFLGYELISRIPRESASAGNPVLANLDVRLTGMEERLEKLEAKKGSGFARKDQAADSKDEPSTAAAQPAEPSKPAVKTVYHFAFAQPGHSDAAPAAAAVPDPEMARRVSALQQGLGTLESSETANREAWQATTNRLADMAGQVGTQSADILKSQDELNRLLARSEMEAIPFELLRGSNPQPVGPVSLVLKSSNAKKQAYTLCVYTQPPCIELKDRTLHEVVQFVVSRNTTPLEVIATKITKDGVLGYLEVPRSLSAH